MYKMHLKGYCSPEHSLSCELEERLLTSVGPNRTYLAELEIDSMEGKPHRYLPIFLRYSPYKKQLSFIPVSDFHIELSFFNKRKAYYLSNPKGERSNVTRDKIVSVVDKITFGEGLCVSSEAPPRTYFKIPLPQSDRFFGTIRHLDSVTGIDEARKEAMNVINTKEPIIIE